MDERRYATIDGNEGAARVAYRLVEVIAIYPITPASPMGEVADVWSSAAKPNLWGDVPSVTEMQSEAGAAGTVHGAIQAGALATTFTASQGLLLMIPNMYKIAGELTPFVMHVASRSLATHALSIFGDHQDVMACRATGFAMLCAASVQEAHDFALIAHAATLESRLPFLHFFDGFRTSHEIDKIELLADDDLRAMIDESWIDAHRKRALTPDRPVLRGTAQNPDVYFQAREAANLHYDACPDVVERAFDRFAKQVGRRYHLFDYAGHEAAKSVIVILGSGGETAKETAAWMNERGEEVGVLQTRLYRPFDAARLLAALPPTVERIAVLDRTKEPGSLGEPLFLDVAAAIREAEVAGRSTFARPPVVIGGRYGLSSKEFTPGMVKGVYEELARAAPRPRITVGIEDDITQLSVDQDPDFDIEEDSVVRAVFFGLGSDGTVGANKNSIKIIGEETENFAQGYFVYDSRKAGAITISHLRFGPEPIHAPYLIRQASFVAAHQFSFLDHYDVVGYAAPGATLLLNAPYGPDRVWDELPREVQEAILEKKLSVHVIDAGRVAHEAGMGPRINTIMQTCFFALSGVLPRDEAIGHIKHAIEKTYAKKGDEVVERNRAAVDAALDHLHPVELPDRVTTDRAKPPIVPAEAPEFVEQVTALMLEGKGDLLPVSVFPVDGTWPVGTTQWEKRNIAYEIPIWEPDICIQCNKCAFVCPHAAIRAKIYDPGDLEGAPDSFQSVEYRWKDFPGKNYTIQVAPEDCTGCSLCVHVCPAKDKSNPRRKAINMKEQLPRRDRERERYGFFLDLPELDRTAVEVFDVKTSQLAQPLFEYSSACAGCGETPYLKLLTQLYGDRLLVANATGCSSIYGGNLPTTPWRTNDDGRGPAWSNSLFEDDAEFGLGFRLAVDAHEAQAARWLRELAGELGDDLVTALLECEQRTDLDVAKQRERIARLREKLASSSHPGRRQLDA
ncbi:MAG: pyruvate:ferredoxin (flavodoxin) oxidoreductase, partial [Planctomycetota bacterium]